MANRNRNTLSRSSVLAEIELLRELAIQRVLHELLAALGAQVKAKLFVHFATDLVAAILRPLQHLLDFLQVIAVVLDIHDGLGIERRVDFHLHDVSQIVRVERPLAAVTRIMNHKSVSTNIDTRHPYLTNNS
jgi:hypothetical protein